MVLQREHYIQQSIYDSKSFFCEGLTKKNPLSSNDF